MSKSEIYEVFGGAKAQQARGLIREGDVLESGDLLTIQGKKCYKCLLHFSAMKTVLKALKVDQHSKIYFQNHSSAITKFLQLAFSLHDIIG